MALIILLQLVLLASRIFLGVFCSEPPAGVSVVRDIEQLEDAVECIQENINQVRELVGEKEETDDHPLYYQPTQQCYSKRPTLLQGNSETQNLALTEKLEAIKSRLEYVVQEVQQLKCSVSRSCGGFIDISNSNDVKILHRSPENFHSGYQEVCIWIVWAKTNGPIRVRLQNTSLVQFNETNSVFGTACYFNNSPNASFLQASSRWPEQTCPSRFVAVIYQSRLYEPGQGVYFSVSDLGIIESKMIPKPMIFNDDPKLLLSSSFRYPPPPAVTYEPNENVFMMFKGVVGKRLSLKVSNIDVEQCCDWILVQFFSIQERVLKSSRLSAATPLSYTFDDNEPAILIFLSDGGNQQSGFSVDFSYA